MAGFQKKIVVQIDHLNKYFEDVHALEDISFSVEEGEFLWDWRPLPPARCW